MKTRLLCLFLFLSGYLAQAQVIVKKDSIAQEQELGETENDSILETIFLDEVVVSKYKLDYAAQKEFLLLKARVYKVYPFAKIASERLTLLDRNMSKLKTNREKKKYFKLVEDYIENEFTDKLKKLSRKQGQILVKLVYRQTGESVYKLIKDYKSGFKAFFYNNTGKLFDIDIKRGYSPEDVNEDYLIEGILDEAFRTGRLTKQPPYRPINLDDLDALWLKRAQEQAEKKEEAKN